MHETAGERLAVRDATEVDLDAPPRLKPSRAVHLDRLRDAQQPGFRYLVLELDRQLIGFVCLVFVRPTYWSDGDSSEYLPTAIDFIIDPQLRGQGYGTFLLQSVEKLAAACGYEQLYIWVNPVNNPRALALYQRLGFRPLQEQPYWFHWQFIDGEGKRHAGDSWRLDLVKTL
jgi:GNAT superfamily N-acetyltransferase